MTEARRGVLAMVGACTIWGLSPLYYKLLTHVPPLEVLSHRALWSLAFFGMVLMIQRRLPEIPKLLAKPSRLGLVAVASMMISTNWGLYIWSVQSDRVTEASLGYYIFPLVAVLFGAVIFGERLGAVRWAAVALAAGAVGVLWAGLGVLPWVSLALALTFGVYGVLKKQSEAGPIVSVTAEVLLLAPIALVYLFLLLPEHEALDPVSLGLLAVSGPLTAGPLILMSYASKRVGLSTLGIIQYLNPTLQFLCAVAIFAEPITLWHMLAFPMIWMALAIYSAESVRQERSARRRERQASTVSGASR